MTESKMSTQIASPRAMSMMHDWTSVNGWSRPTTKAEYGARLEVSGARSQLALRRCQTNMEKQQVFRPLRHSQIDSCTMDFIKHLENLNKETEAKLKETMQVLSLHRSKTELDNRDSQTLFGNLASNGLFKEKTHMYLTDLQNLSRFKEPTNQSNKQEMKIGLAVVPRKGLISLQTTGTEMYSQQPVLNGSAERRYPSPVLPIETGLTRSRSLIKRSRILHHIKLGNKRLEQDEENKQKDEEIGKHLGDYTILDLQTSLLELTDTKTMRRHTSLTRADLTRHQRNSNQERVQKSVTLPAIKTLTPFKMK